MIIKRTANAGVLLELDDVSFLLDGVAEELVPYIGTPQNIRENLTQNPPDVVAFTHLHKDHYDKSYSEEYTKRTLRPVYGPECLPPENTQNIEIEAVPTRHIGKAEIPHISYVIYGSKCVWFMGDASPLMWKDADKFPKPDVVIAPYAYAITASAWNITKSLGAKEIVLVHFPLRECDEHGLWNLAQQNVGEDSSVHIPDIGQVIEI